MAVKKKAAPAAKTTAKKSPKDTPRPTTSGAKGSKKPTPAKQYKDTMRSYGPRF
jgi:hypothetical protein